MDARAVDLLRTLGDDLDRGVFPEVRNGGLVVPGRATSSFLMPGAEYLDEQQFSAANGPSAQPRTGPEGWTWPAGQSGAFSGSRTSGSASQFARDPVCRLSHELEQLKVAYPGTQIWRQDAGAWLYVPSALLPGLGRSASFLIAIVPWRYHVSAWGFWVPGAMAPLWIGPRHTNYGDGSICAFDARDQCWSFGDSLVTLVDIFSVWTIRQLHLEIFGWWPGPQASSNAHERLLEFNDREWCGCGSRTRYGDCCKQQDKASVTIQGAVHSAISCRHPPASVARFVCALDHPPSLGHRPSHETQTVAGCQA